MNVKSWIKVEIMEPWNEDEFVKTLTPYWRDSEPRRLWLWFVQQRRERLRGSRIMERVLAAGRITVEKDRERIWKEIEIQRSKGFQDWRTLNV